MHRTKPLNFDKVPQSYKNNKFFAPGNKPKRKMLYVVFSFKKLIINEFNTTISVNQLGYKPIVVKIFMSMFCSTFSVS